jgi:zinc protease
MSSAESAPVAQGLRALYALVWAGHPYRWPASGLADDLARITLADCVAFRRERYGPGTTLVTVVGHFDPAVAEASVRRAFAGVARRPSLPGAPVAVASSSRRATRRTEAQVPLVFAGWRTPPDSSADGAALEVLARALGSGGHRLERELIQRRRLCLLTQGDLDSRREGGLLFAIAAARGGADTAAVESALVGEVENLATEPLQSEELEGAKRQAEAELLMGWQTTRGFAQSLGAARLLDDDVATLERRLAQLRALTSDDVSRAAASALIPGNRAVVWLMPGATPAPAPSGTRAPRPTPVKKGGQ